MAKTTFVFHREWYDAYKGYPDELRGRIYDAIVKYAFEGIEPEYTDPVRMAFDVIRQLMDLDVMKYEAIQEKRRTAGQRGGLQRAANASKTKQSKQMLDLVSKTKQTQANEANPSISNSVSVSDNINSVIISTHTRDDDPRWEIEEAFRAEALKNQSWAESLMMRHHLTPATFPQKWNEFLLHCDAGNISHDSENDVQQHFNLWLLKQKDNENKPSVSNRAERKRQAGVDAVSNSLAAYYRNKEAISEP